MNKPANLDFYSSDFSPTVYGSKQEYIENNPIHSSLTDEDYKKIADFMLEFHEDNQAFEVEVDKTHLDAIEHVYGKPLHFDSLNLSLKHINDPFDTVVLTFSP